MDNLEHKIVITPDEYKILGSAVLHTRNGLEREYDSNPEYYDSKAGLGFKELLEDANSITKRLLLDDLEFLGEFSTYLKNQKIELVSLPFDLLDAWPLSHGLMGELFRVKNKIWTDSDRLIFGLLFVLGFQQILFKRYKDDGLFNNLFESFPEWMKELIKSSTSLDVEVSTFGEQVASPTTNLIHSEESIKAALIAPSIYELIEAYVISKIGNQEN